MIEVTAASSNGVARRTQGASRATGALRFGVPAKGRIGEEVFEFLEGCGLKVRRGSERALTGKIRGFSDIEVIFQRSADIMAQVADGRLDMGISNVDVLHESGVEQADLLLIYKYLGFSVGDIAVEVPDGWVDVTTMADLADVAASLRDSGSDLRVATSYPNLTRQFLYASGISHFSLVELEGGVEAAPTVGFADIVVDIVTTGVTLKENHLKTLRNGQILHSEACLVGNRRALAASAEKREIVRRVIELIEARMRAQQFYSVTANLRGRTEEDVAAALLTHAATRGKRGPTVARVFAAESEVGEMHWFAATIIVDSASLQAAVDHLREVGGSGMSVIPVRYLFDERSEHYDALTRTLGLS